MQPSKEMKSCDKFTVKICEDCVIRDSDKVKRIIERVSKIISKSYIPKC